MENKTETKVSYDDRRKEFTQFVKTIQEVKVGEETVGESVMERKATFKEPGIRKILADMANQQMKLEQTIKQIKNSLKDVPELTPELKELEEKIKAINDFNKSEQVKLQLKTQEEELKLVKKDIREIKETIGTRLNL